MVKVIRASALVLLLACSAQAGWIQNGSPAPQPPSQPTNSVEEPPTCGEVHDPGAAASLTEIVLDLLAVLPSLH
jgi:hypothetical protein